MKHNRIITTKNGFTIVELVVIIVIIAILAAITIVSYSAVTKNANMQTSKTDAQTMGAQLSKYKADNGQYPANLSSIESSTSIKSTFQYDYDAINDKYCLTASTKDTSAYVKSGFTSAEEGGCPGHGTNGKPAATNYAPNPGYEGPNGWHSNNGAAYSVSADTSVYRSGVRSIRGSNLSPSTAMVSAYAVGGVSGNGYVSPGPGTYTHSVYFRSGVAHNGRVSVAWRIGGAWSTTLTGPTVSGTINEWTRVSQTFTLPSNVEFVRSGAFINSEVTQPAGVPAWIDDYMIVEGSDSPEYADGSSASWIWNGAPHASTSTGPRL